MGVGKRKQRQAKSPGNLGDEGVGGRWAQGGAPQEGERGRGRETGRAGGLETSNRSVLGEGVGAGERGQGL